MENKDALVRIAECHESVFSDRFDVNNGINDGLTRSINLRGAHTVRTAYRALLAPRRLINSRGSVAIP